MATATSTDMPNVRFHCDACGFERIIPLHMAAPTGKTITCIQCKKRLLTREVLPHSQNCQTASQK